MTDLQAEPQVLETPHGSVPESTLEQIHICELANESPHGEVAEGHARASGVEGLAPRDSHDEARSGSNGQAANFEAVARDAKREEGAREGRAVDVPEDSLAEPSPPSPGPVVEKVQPQNEVNQPANQSAQDDLDRQPKETNPTVLQRIKGGAEVNAPKASASVKAKSSTKARKR